SMKPWSPDSKTHVATMASCDFVDDEKSLTIEKPTQYRVVYIDESGNETELKAPAPLIEGELLDTSILCFDVLSNFLEEQIKDAKEKGVLFSIHLKATMMKV